MDSELKTKWVEALRSGKFKQASGRLQRDDGFCCLGVLCKVAGYGIDQQRDYALLPDGTSLPDDSYGPISKIGVSDDVRGVLISMNDGGKPFPQIADYIEAKL